MAGGGFICLGKHGKINKSLKNEELLSSIAPTEKFCHRNNNSMESAIHQNKKKRTKKNSQPQSWCFFPCSMHSVWRMLFAVVALIDITLYSTSCWRAPTTAIHVKLEKHLDEINTTSSSSLDRIHHSNGTKKTNNEDNTDIDSYFTTLQKSGTEFMKQFSFFFNNGSERGGVSAKEGFTRATTTNLFHPLLNQDDTSTCIVNNEDDDNDNENEQKKAIVTTAWWHKIFRRRKTDEAEATKSAPTPRIIITGTQLSNHSYEDQKYDDDTTIDNEDEDEDEDEEDTDEDTDRNSTTVKKGCDADADADADVDVDGDENEEDNTISIVLSKEHNIIKTFWHKIFRKQDENQFEKEDVASVSSQSNICYKDDTDQENGKQQHILSNENKNNNNDDANNDADRIIMNSIVSYDYYYYYYYSAKESVTLFVSSFFGTTSSAGGNHNNEKDDEEDDSIFSASPTELVFSSHTQSNLIRSDSHETCDPKREKRTTTGKIKKKKKKKKIKAKKKKKLKNSFVPSSSTLTSSMILTIGIHILFGMMCLIEMIVRSIEARRIVFEHEAITVFENKFAETIGKLREAFTAYIIKF